MERTSFDAQASLNYLWTELGLPKAALSHIELPGTGLGLPSSFKVGILAQSSVGLTALLAALLYSIKTGKPLPRVSVPLEHAVIEFSSEKLYSIDGQPTPSAWGPIGGLHKTLDGYVRLHDGFPNHRYGAKTLLGCDREADRQAVGAQIAKWRSVELETAAAENKLVIAALRSYGEWDALPQAEAIGNFPILVKKIADGHPRLAINDAPDKCLRGLKVLEMSRVIAAPVAGRTLAAHGADVLWITGPAMPDLPAIDRDVGRGKRTAQLDVDKDRNTLLSLLADADVFVQSFRPSSLASKGLSTDELVKNSKEGIVLANLSAYGPDGPWRERRGFDSLVQTCSGMNVSEAEHFGAGEPARPTPCQALDHAGGYFLAAGIMTALYRQATEGGSYQVDVTLAGVMKYLRSLGQYEGKSGFTCQIYRSIEDVPEDLIDTQMSAFGELRAIKHSASIEGVSVGWDIMPKPLGSDEAEWL